MEKLSYEKGVSDALKKYVSKKGTPLIRGRDLVGWKEKSVAPAKLANGGASV